MWCRLYDITMVPPYQCIYTRRNNVTQTQNFYRLIWMFGTPAKNIVCQRCLFLTKNIYHYFLINFVVFPKYILNCVPIFFVFQHFFEFLSKKFFSIYEIFLKLCRPHSFVRRIFEHVLYSNHTPILISCILNFYINLTSIHCLVQNFPILLILDTPVYQNFLRLIFLPHFKKFGVRHSGLGRI